MKPREMIKNIFKKPTVSSRWVDDSDMILLQLYLKRKGYKIQSISRVQRNDKLFISYKGGSIDIFITPEDDIKSLLYKIDETF